MTRKPNMVAGAREALADLRIDVEIVEIGRERVGDLARRADEGDVVDRVNRAVAEQVEVAGRRLNVVERVDEPVAEIAERSAAVGGREVSAVRGRGERTDILADDPKAGAVNLHAIDAGQALRHWRDGRGRVCLGEVGEPIGSRIAGGGKGGSVPRIEAAGTAEQDAALLADLRADERRAPDFRARPKLRVGFSDPRYALSAETSRDARIKINLINSAVR